MNQNEESKITIGDVLDWVILLAQFLIIIFCFYYAQKLDFFAGGIDASIDTIATFLAYFTGIIVTLALQVLRIRYVNSKRNINLLNKIEKEAASTNSLIMKPILIRSDFRGEVQSIVNSSKDTLLCLLRTGSIIGESYTKSVFKDALYRGVTIKIIVCRMHKEIVNQIAIEMADEVGQDGVMKKFGVFLNGYNNLAKTNKGKIEIRTLDYLPSTLKFISDHEESYGRGFVVPVSFKTHVRRAPSILAIKAEQGDILEYYIKEFSKYWKAAEPIDERISFHGDLDLDNVRMRIKSIAGMDGYEIEKMLSIFDKYGWLILQLPNNPSVSPRQSLIDLKRYFGDSVNHSLSEKDGITVIQQNNDPDKNIYKSQGNSDHPLHTGGTHLKNPPKVVALYCETPSNQGGTSHIMSGKSIFQHLFKNNHEGLEEVCKDSSITVKRGNQSATKSIFSLQKNGRFQVTFRKDDTASTDVIKEANQAFNSICKFRDNSKNRVEFNLKQHEIYIVDNTAILHGRTSYEKNSPRRMLRLNMNGESEYSKEIIFGFKEF